MPVFGNVGGRVYYKDCIYVWRVIVQKTVCFLYENQIRSNKATWGEVEEDMCVYSVNQILSINTNQVLQQSYAIQMLQKLQRKRRGIG